MKVYTEAETKEFDHGYKLADEDSHDSWGGYWTARFGRLLPTLELVERGYVDIAVEESFWYWVYKQPSDKFHLWQLQESIKVALDGEEIPRFSLIEATPNTMMLIIPVDL